MQSATVFSAVIGTGIMECANVRAVERDGGAGLTLEPPAETPGRLSQKLNFRSNCIRRSSKSRPRFWVEVICVKPARFLTAPSTFSTRLETLVPGKLKWGVFR